MLLMKFKFNENLKMNSCFTVVLEKNWFFFLNFLIQTEEISEISKCVYLIKSCIKISFFCTMFFMTNLKTIKTIQFKCNWNENNY